MALELTIWTILIIISLMAFLFGIYKKVSFVFIIGCILLAISGISLFAFDGLVLDRVISSVAGDGSFVYSLITVDMSNVALMSIGIMLIFIPMISFFIIDFKDVKQTNTNVFHF